MKHFAGSFGVLQVPVKLGKCAYDLMRAEMFPGLLARNASAFADGRLIAETAQAQEGLRRSGPMDIGRAVAAEETAVVLREAKSFSLLEYVAVCEASISVRQVRR